MRTQMSYNQNKIWFDFESTGLNVYHEEIIEIGAINSKGDTFSTLVMPIRKISEKITKITNITNEMVCGSPNEKQALIMFVEYCNNSFRTTNPETPIYLIAHNGNSFDFMFLKQISKRHSVRLPNFVFLDTINLSKLLFPERYSHSLATICKYYSISQENAHRAFDDARVLKLITEYMFKKYDQIYGISEIESVVNKLNSKW